MLWPIKWGGFFGSIIVSGHSMEPTYYTGDLLLIHKASPEVGRIMVYKVPEHQNLQVVHRIRSGDAESGWIFRGDNNTWDDPYTVPTSDLVGTPFLRIPSFGRLTSALANPIVIVSLLILAAGLLLWPRKETKEETEKEITEAPKESANEQSGTESANAMTTTDESTTSTSNEANNSSPAAPAEIAPAPESTTPEPPTKFATEPTPAASPSSTRTAHGRHKSPPASSETPTPEVSSDNT